MIDLKHAIARVIVILIKGTPGDCVSITPSLLGNMIGDVREALRLLRVLYNDPLPALKSGVSTVGVSIVTPSLGVNGLTPLVVTM